MSLEAAMERLAVAVERNTGNAAVAEIIRQRDAWQKRAESLERERNYHSNRRDELWKDGERMGRRIAALRGTITRMKRQRKAEAQPPAGQ